MEQSPPWEANTHSASQEIICLLWKPVFHCRVHKRAALVHILREMLTISLYQQLKS